MIGSYYNLMMLPVPGLNDMTLPTFQQRNNWGTQLRIISGIHDLEKKVGLGPFLKQSLENLAFYCQLAIANLDTEMARTSSWDSSGSAEGISEITQAFMAELPKAKAAWNQWLGESKELQKLEPKKEVKPPAIGMYGGFGSAGDSTKESTIENLARPVGMDRYWLRLGAAAGLFFLAYVFSR